MPAVPRLAQPEEVVLRCRRSYPRERCAGVCLARLHADGCFELLSGAWQGLLGFEPAELDGRALLELLALDPPSGRRLIGRLVDPEETGPMRLELRCKDGRSLPMQWHRRFDAYDRSLYIAAEPLGADATAPLCRAP